MIYAILAVLGLVFGSFVNASVWRLHEQEALRHKKGKTAKRRREQLSIVHGRSMCVHCGHELAAKDLVPVFSWLWLRGRCRYCGVKIDDNPLVELVTGLLFVASYAWWPLGFHGEGLFQFIVWLGLLVAFMLLAVYDLRWFLLPDVIVYPLLVVGFIEILVVAVATHDLHDLWRPLVAALIISGLFYALFQVSDGNWIGGGDVKLAVVLGFLAGTPLKALLLVFLASLVGTVVSVPLAMKAKQNLKLRVPFGPFLLVATLIVVLFGTRIVDWYTANLL